MTRNGRVTPAQSDAIARLMPQWGLPYTSTPISLTDVFGRSAPLWLEVGFGNGDVLSSLGQQRPDINLLGIEVHTAGVGHALLSIEKHSLGNIRLVQHDALEVITQMLPPACVDQLLLLFPDPWHKKRHHKRRIVRKEFLDGVQHILKPGGLLHCATDWADYAQWMVEHLEQDTRFSNINGPEQAAPRPEWRPLTRFERRGHRLGHGVTDLIYRKL